MGIMAFNRKNKWNTQKFLIARAVTNCDFNVLLILKLITVYLQSFFSFFFFREIFVGLLFNYDNLTA